MNFLKSLFLNKTRAGLLIFVIVVGGYFTYKHYSAKAAPIRYVLAQASKQTVVASVSGSGQVSQDRSVNITPPGAGKLTSVSVKQGQKVSLDQTIAVLDETNNSLALNQAKASLASAQASYDQVLAGSTSQDIELAKLALQSDQQAVDDAKANVDTVTKQQTQAVANALSNFLNSSPQAIAAPSNIGNGTISISGTYNAQDQGSYNITAYNSGAGEQFGVTGLEIASGSISKNGPSALGTKGLYVQFSGSIYNNDSWTITLPNPLASNYTSNYNAYQTALTNKAAQIQNAQSQLNNAQNKLQQDTINLQVKQQPPTDQQLESAKAQLISAQTQVQNAEINYGNNILKSPFDGTVAQLNNQAGDQVTASTNIATVITNKSIAQIPLNEVDVSKIKISDKVTMTFDAIDGLAITGKVAQIDGIGTVSQGVVSYNVKIAFDTEDARVKPGMSVNASIITDVQPDVLTVPNSAIQSLNGMSFVQTLDSSQTQTVSGQTSVTSDAAPNRVAVQVGAADDTNTQIISGINESDTVVVQTINPSATTSSSASSASSIFRLGGAGGGGGGGVFRTAGGGATGR